MEPKPFFEEEIDDLLISYVIGSATQEERQKVISWLSGNKINQQYFDQLKDIYVLGKSLRAPSGFDPEKSLERIKSRYYKTRFNELQGEERKPSRIKRLDYRSVIAIAASLLLIVSLGINFKPFVRSQKDISSGLSGLFNEINSPMGARSQITLPDGTLVWLNAGSIIKYPMDFMEGDRRVFLTGEAYFDVKKAPGKRFVVNTSDIAIRVWGTKFNVKAYPDEATIKTTLVEGSISILKLSSSKKNKETYLSPNQTAIYYKNDENPVGSPDPVAKPVPGLVSQSFEIENQINTLLNTSWKDSKWYIEGEALGDLARDLERRYDVKIRFENESLKNYRFNGIIAEETFEQILEIIKVSAPIHYTITNNQVLLEDDPHSKSNYDEYLKR